MDGSEAAGPLPDLPKGQDVCLSSMPIKAASKYYHFPSRKATKDYLQEKEEGS